MISLSRQEIVQTAEIIVVKVGTNVLTTKDGHLNHDRINKLVEGLCYIRSHNKKVILVSSGAVGAGMGLLGIQKRPTEHPQLQAIASIGQSILIQTYEEAMAVHNVVPGQVLLTADDISRRRHYLNARNTFLSLLKYKAIPIVNENDTVSVDELDSTFGDNDRLAALVANLFPEPLLILLTDVDGLYDGDPALKTSKLISVVDNWNQDLMNMVAEKRSSRSKGGMSSKLKAAKMVTTSGGSVIIADGDDDTILRKIYAGEEVGTVFFPTRPLHARKRWIGFAVAPKGTLMIDDGAVEALLKKGKSLLPVGIIRTSGIYEKGDIVAVVNTNNMEIARGLANYGWKEVALWCGKKNSEIKHLFGPLPYEEIIHRDNIQLTD